MLFLFSASSRSPALRRSRLITGSQTGWPFADRESAHDLPLATNLDGAARWDALVAIRASKKSDGQRDRCWMVAP